MIEDNYPKLAVEAIELRIKANGTGQLVGGLIRSTESHKTKLGSLLSTLFSPLPHDPHGSYLCVMTLYSLLSPLSLDLR